MDASADPGTGGAARSAADSEACTACGACCAAFRVDFSICELQSQGGSVPDGLTVELRGMTCRMRGTDHVPVRCAALTGTIGQRVACAIYEWRPSPCREFSAGDHACDLARRRHGLRPIGEDGQSVPDWPARPLS